MGTSPNQWAARCRMKAFSSNKYIFTAAGVLVLCLLWQLCSFLVSNPVLLPGPLEVFPLTAAVAGTPGFAADLGATVLRGLLGYILAVVSALGTGILCGLFPRIKAFFSPIAVLVKGVPVIAVILLAVIWFTSANVGVFVAFLMSFPILFTAISEGFSSFSKKYNELAVTYRLPRATRLVNINIPQVLPFLISGAKTALGITWKVVIAAEVLAQPAAGIGARMQEARLYLDTGLVFAYLVAALVLTGVTDFVFSMILRKMDWRPKSGV